MAEAHQPLLVYDRIDENRRHTYLLLLTFVILILPLACVPAVFLSLFYSNTHIAPLLIAITITFAIVVVWVEDFYSSGLLFKQLEARRLGAQEEPGLRRTVENLCIGAGLPQPRLFIIESASPNSFAVGRDPEHASLAVTRGLLSLLDRRELAAVIAHELSHIGNRDTRLNTILAALVTTLCFPVKLGTWMRGLALPQDKRALGVLAFLSLVIGVTTQCDEIFAGRVSHRSHDPRGVILERPWRILWGAVHNPWLIVIAAYAIFAAPALAAFVRRSISREREFQADADAVLLTRDSEALALALAKVSAAAGAGMRAGAATAHLYFVDPLPSDAAWSDRLFPSHPGTVERIDLLAKMGSAVPPGALLRAASAGNRYENEAASRLMAQELTMSGPPVIGEDTQRGAQVTLSAPETLLYREPNGSSAVLAKLDRGSVVTYLETALNFARVQTSDGVGYIARFRRVDHESISDDFAIDEQTPIGTGLQLTADTPLYERADGWSNVLEYLNAGTNVTFNGLTGNFARVAVAYTAGYISRLAPARHLESGVPTHSPAAES